MNKIYDKLLLALAVLLLLAGVGFYVMNAGDLPEAEPGISTEPADNEYAPIPVPESTETTVDWPEVEEQSTGWRYDVFTPPKIYIGEDGRFTNEPWVVEDQVEKPPFGIELVSVSRDLYRLQIEGYVEEDREDPSRNLVLLYDEERQRSVRARVGDEKPQSEFTLTDFTIERVRRSESNIERVARATIRDHRTGDEVVLTEGERVYEDTITVILRSTEDPTIQVELTEPGETFETPSGEYVLQEINLEQSTVTVKKLGDESLDLEPETQVLSPAGAAPSPEPSNTTENTEPPGDAGAQESNEAFDFMF